MFFGLLILVVATSCRVDADVLVDVAPDGSGTVTVSVILDAEAAAKLGDPGTAIKTGDLSAAGWKVSKPTVDKGSKELTLSAVREFSSPRQLAAVLTEIGGGTPEKPGVFSGVKLEISDGFASTEYRFRTKVALSGSLEQFSDPALTEALGGLALGRTPEELAAEGASKESLHLTFTVELPGDAPESNGAKVGRTTRWTLEPASGTPTDVDASATATESQTTVPLLIAAGALLVVAAAGMAGAALLRARR